MQKLQLVNPFSLEKFGDPITIVCQLNTESLTDEDFSYYESKNTVINGINVKAGNAVEMIDDLLNGLEISRIDDGFDGQSDQSQFMLVNSLSHQMQHSQANRY